MRAGIREGRDTRRRIDCERFALQDVGQVDECRRGLLRHPRGQLERELGDVVAVSVTDSRAGNRL
ncbi:hypothetical protein D7Y13_38390 [Corallococcus praedator]|uniref:Uncharacterized protein n=1 Tax=Corallococcus praedator TaxID=2316724 RepID=A0ABX9Q689_9BACT|nr:hypothetical protein D7X75_33025 [Corallococcus sp. CA031C]RKH91781.1 hypothetical protein D7Y13_38390 [Corallococcus praedator]